MRHDCPATRTHRLAVLIGALLGVMNLFAGGRVLLGLWQPDHPVLLPLVIFNTVMGGLYILAALRIRSDAVSGRAAAAVVAALNLGVLVVLLARAASGALVPSDSIFAMSLRSAAWLVILVLVVRVAQASTERSSPTATTS